ncbi:MAG TPA: HAMP domain-containing sensor histidine kinase, partial [Polyangiaceae bacterium]|nr:HAMP domain-containing sensor histidine kinase [Polyangiaceae bacterium]
TDALRHADRVATVGRLAAGMAHELGTPLNVVAARAKQIAAGSTTPEATRENARIIADQVERMSRIMRQLLDFARKRELQSVSTDLRSILKRAATFLSPLARKRGLDLRVVNPPEPIVARIDVAQMDQVVTNLVMNAIHASPEGKRVSVELSQAVGQYPAAEAKTSVPCVRIDVTDEGSGIEQENLRQIFDPFFTTKPIGEGTGLGLSVAYGIVKDHGGWIDVDSEPGRGSRFTVWLPTEVS